MTEPDDDTEPAERPAPDPRGQVIGELRASADGVVEQGTSPWPVSENKDHL